MLTAYSDIRAELDKLQDSGISKYENDMGLPEYVYADMAQLPPDAATTEYMLYYSAQIQLRKILNRAHLALYSKSKSSTLCLTHNSTLKSYCRESESCRKAQLGGCHSIRALGPASGLAQCLTKPDEVARRRASRKRR